MASSSRVFILAFVLCAATAHSSGHSSPSKGSKHTKLWYSFTASFGKMSGNTTILQKNIDNFIRNEVMPKIDAFKLVETEGVWKGQTENSFDIFVLSDNFSEMMKKMQDICLLYKTKFAQDSVLLFYERAKVFFL
jgi:hypothetical protein